MGIELERGDVAFNAPAGYEDSRLIGGSSGAPVAPTRLGKEEMGDTIQGMGEGDNFVPFLPAEKRPEFRNVPKKYNEPNTVSTLQQVVTNEFLNAETGEFAYKNRKGKLNKSELIEARSILAAAVKRALLEEIENLDAPMHEEQPEVEVQEGSSAGEGNVPSVSGESQAQHSEPQGKV